MGQLVGMFGGSYSRAGAMTTLIYSLGLVLIWFRARNQGKTIAGLRASNKKGTGSEPYWGSTVIKLRSEVPVPFLLDAVRENHFPMAVLIGNGVRASG